MELAETNRIQVSDCGLGPAPRQAKVALHTEPHLILTSALKARPVSPLWLREVRSPVQGHTASKEARGALFFLVSVQLGLHLGRSHRSKELSSWSRQALEKSSSSMVKAQQDTAVSGSLFGGADKFLRAMWGQQRTPRRMCNPQSR